MGIKRILLLICIVSIIGCKKEIKENYYFKEGIYSMTLIPDEGLPPRTHPLVCYFYIKENRFFPAENAGTRKDTFCLERESGILISTADSVYIPRLRIAKSFYSVCTFEDEKYGGDTFVLFPSKLTPIQWNNGGGFSGRYRLIWPRDPTSKTEYGTFEM
ncbi:MAG: hypothetical protein CFE21_02170 [Bacteroidetes bacterium B1(2017)]|nr:MAG: hypothetical protein CFE21_02170 [Bacteroidetes bacterium B1(2017)]